MHLNRLIIAHDLNMMYVIGPGHGGPGIVANTYLEGTYSEIYPKIEQSGEGMQETVQVSSPCRAVFPATLRRKRPAPFMKAASWDTRLLHAYGAAFDNPDLIVCLRDR